MKVCRDRQGDKTELDLKVELNCIGKAEDPRELRGEIQDQVHVHRWMDGWTKGKGWEDSQFESAVKAKLK